MCFGTVIFLLEDSINRSTANLQIPGRRKKHVQRDKNGNANNVCVLCNFSSSFHMQFLLKSQNTKVTNTQLKISYSKHNVTYRLPYKRNKDLGIRKSAFLFKVSYVPLLFAQMDNDIFNEEIRSIIL